MRPASSPVRFNACPLRVARRVFLPLEGKGKSMNGSHPKGGRAQKQTDKQTNNRTNWKITENGERRQEKRKKTASSVLSTQTYCKVSTPPMSHLKAMTKQSPHFPSMLSFPFFPSQTHPSHQPRKPVSRYTRYTCCKTHRTPTATTC
ncbi:hypothetical protein VTJ04DRAFT_482 [Mycothermus thermophilus]|uniref:uncharacterized protein n=1 Tax=Humicola insolens TaxID=85995 RepID=UPI0037449974